MVGSEFQEVPTFVRTSYLVSRTFGSVYQGMRILIVIFSLIVLVTSCKKEGFITSSEARLVISADTLHFDTVFTSTGSITLFLRIFNENDQKLLINNVTLAGGASSPFKINVDGYKGPSVSNLEIEANDSLHVFVTVTINPTAANLPFVIQDSIKVEYNGNTRWVQLDAWGRNANFLRSKVITANETWTNTKPYVILGGLQVDTNVTLTIDKGCRIYVHADAPVVIDGTLITNGEKYDSTKVIFRGDRLDDPYRDFPAGWPGIFFRGQSKDNVLNYTVIKNAFQGLVTDQPSVNANPKLTLKQCEVDNCYDAGILALHSSIKAENTLVSNCGKNVILAQGGNYDFTHCTIVAYSNLFVLHKEPVLLITNFIKQDNIFLTADLNAIFKNCIFWGDNGTVDDEVVTGKQGTNPFVLNFQNCLWKVKNTPGNITSATNMLTNQDPLFDSVNNQQRFYNFRLKDGSPAINSGFVTGLSVDLDGNPRAVGNPDRGSYEKQ